MEDIAVDLASKAAESLVDQVVRACRYVICYDTYLGELDNEARNLNGAMQRVHHSVEKAENNMMLIEADVKNWAIDAESLACKARDLLTREEKAKKTCFYGCFPNPKVRYDVAKEATETVKAIRELISKGKFNSVSYESDPPGYVPNAPNVNPLAGDRGISGVISSAGDGVDTITESRASIFQGIIKALEDENHKVIGVFGPGDVGKTTLLEEVEKKLREMREPFRWIAKAKVSQTPDLKNIQDDIARALGLELKDVLNRERRKDLLFKRLRKNPSEKILIILDDLWAELDLKEIGDPLGCESTKCKLLLTSRNQQVLERRMRSYPTFHLKGAADLNSSAADGGDIITGSRASIFQDIMEALGDEKLKVIGVYGPGGVGKTTLLKKVKEKLGEEGSPFDMILTAEVSQTPDLNNIRDQIADCLGLDLRQKQSVEKRGDLLLERLQRDPNEKILVILDNLLVGVDLTKIGIPSGDESRGCKLLLSSRFKDVLEPKMRADRTFLLEGLKKDEAFKLFQKTVGDRLKDDEELKPIAAGVATKLAGLPLLINSVATALKNSDVAAWRDASEKIDVKEMETIVQLSYDHLTGDGTKSLFLLCGLIGGTIKVETLLVLAMGMGLIERRTMQGSRDRLDIMLSELRSACLLLDSGDDKKNVTIHDLYSEVVVSTPFRGENSLMMNNNSWSEEKLEKCWAICLMDVSSDRLAQLTRCGFPHGFPDLKTLMLSQPQDSWGRPEHRHDEGDCCRLDFTCMKKLRVLYIRSMHIPTLPSSIQIVENLQSLYLDECEVKDVAILGKLKALQILSFAGSTISVLPKEIGDLTNLKSLNLSECYKLAIIEPGVLKGLVNLEELYMRGSFEEWTSDASESCNAKLAELKSLTKLSALEISIPEPTLLLEAGDLPFGNLTRFWINVGNVPGTRLFDCLTTMRLRLEGCQSILSKEWIQNTLSKAESLSFVNLNLEKIWNGPVAPDCFSKLKAVRIEKCHGLKNLWFLSEMQRLVHLEKIEVRNCNSLQAIITDDGGIVAADDYIELPNVRRLDLRDLPNMLSFCTGAEGAPIQVSFPRLESLVMVGLLDLEKILYRQSSWILKLPNLESLEIHEGQSTKVVFDLEGLEVPGHVEILPQLTKLRLISLPDLQHVWKHDVKLQGLSAFRNLKELHVWRTGLAFLFSVSVAKCLREIRYIRVTGCEDMEAVIVDEEGRDEGTDDIIEFPKLEKLRIVDCPMKKFFSCPRGKRYSYSFFDRKVSLPNLKELRLTGGSFTRIWHDELPRSFLCELATLDLKDCSNLGNVFPSTVIGRLHNLKQVGVSNCYWLESLFDCGSLDPNTEQTRVLLPKLEKVDVNKCPLVESLFDFESLDSNTEQTIVLFPTLEKLTVDAAEKLSDSQTVLDFPLTNVNCKQLKEVVPKEEGSRSKGVVMSFPSLRHITIRGCKENDEFPHNRWSMKWLNFPM